MSDSDNKVDGFRISPDKAKYSNLLNLDFIRHKTDTKLHKKESYNE